MLIKVETQATEMAELEQQLETETAKSVELQEKLTSLDVIQGRHSTSGELADEGHLQRLPVDVLVVGDDGRVVVDVVVDGVEVDRVGARRLVADLVGHVGTDGPVDGAPSPTVAKERDEVVLPEA